LASFRFLHAADIHLDSPLRGLASYDEPTAEQIRSATRDAFDNLVTLAIKECVSFLIIAGDLYDGEWRDYQTGLFFLSQMGRLNQAGIPVFFLYGNHDAESGITPRLMLPENVKVFPERKPETRKLKEPGVALHGQSFPSREVTESLVQEYPEPVPGLSISAFCTRRWGAWVIMPTMRPAPSMTSFTRGTITGRSDTSIRAAFYTKDPTLCFLAISRDATSEKSAPRVLAWLRSRIGKSPR
jgi:hypothetical protein